MLESLRIIQADKAHELGFFGKGVLVGVADTGIDPKYLSLHRNLVVSKDFTGAGVLDRIGHGTVASALICNPGGNYPGVAPEAKLIVARCLDKEGSGYDYWIIDALEWLASLKVDVINLSLGGEEAGVDRDPLCREVNHLVKRGINVVAAAGNKGPLPMTIGAPGAASGAITVGATDKVDRLAHFSSRGPTRDQGAKPDCVAPGSNVLVPSLRHIRPQVWRRWGPLGSFFEPGYLNVGSSFISVSGTSFASPFVAGGVALLLDERSGYGGLNPAGIRTRLLENCDPVKGELSGQSRQQKREALPACIRLKLFLNPDRYKWGRGRVNVWRALNG